MKTIPSVDFLQSTTIQSPQSALQTAPLTKGSLIRGGRFADSLRIKGSLNTGNKLISAQWKALVQKIAHLVKENFYGLRFLDFARNDNRYSLEMTINDLTMHYDAYKPFGLPPL